MKFPTTAEMAKEVDEKAFDEYVYEGKTIRQWIEVLKDYDDKQTTLEKIVERLEDMYQPCYLCREDRCAIDRAIEIVKEGLMND